MATNTQQILREALELPTIERASLADHLLSSLDQPDEHIFLKNAVGNIKREWKGAGLFDLI